MFPSSTVPQHPPPSSTSYPQPEGGTLGDWLDAELFSTPSAGAEDLSVEFGVFFFSPSWGNDDSQFWWAYFLNWVAETNQNSPLGRHVSMEKTSMKQWMILIHTFAYSFHLIWNKSKENPWLFCGETKILSNPTDVVVNIKKHGCEKKTKWMWNHGRLLQQFASETRKLEDVAQTWNTKNGV